MGRGLEEMAIASIEFAHLGGLDDLLRIKDYIKTSYN